MKTLEQMTNLEMLKDAYILAAQSPDLSTQIGAFLVSYNNQHEQLTRSYNRPCDGYTMSACEWERPHKYSLVEHAERNALYAAAKYGIPTAGGTLVASWAACADCARAIVQCGIVRLVRHYPPLDEATERWLASVTLGDHIMRSAGVEITNVLGPIPGAPTILRSGELFDPTCS